MKFSPAAWSLLGLAPFAQACLEDHELLKDAAPLVRRQGNNGYPIGTADRFEGGNKFPRGLGTQPPGTEIPSILSVKEVNSALKGLAKEYGIETFNTPYQTYNNATIIGAKVGGEGKCADAYRVFFNAAIHARERGGPDNILYFISDLLYAKKNNIGVAYGGRTYSACDVRRALNVGVVFLPLSNPDGVAHDQTTNTCWRKNRNPAKATPGNPATVGIDLNRNFDFLWDFPRLFEETVTDVASEDPAAQTYHGTSAFSEPETKSIKWVLDTFPKVRWFMDIHSVAGVILYNWGSDENQARKPSMNFLNSSYNAVRGLMPDNPSAGKVYSEFVPRQDWSDTIFAGMRVGNAMDAVAGRHFEVTQSCYLYPTSGASDDYAYSRHFANPGLNKVHGYTMEFGFPNNAASCPFYPTKEGFHNNILETGAGFMEFLLSASEIGVGEKVSCPAA